MALMSHGTFLASRIIYIPVVEAVGLWDERVFCSFQALARQIHSLPLVLPMLLPRLGRRGVDVHCGR